MTEKKILDAEQKKIVDEVLSDGELDKVAGGTFMFGEPVAGPGLMNSDGTPYKVPSGKIKLGEFGSTGH